MEQMYSLPIFHNSVYEGGDGIYACSFALNRIKNHYLWLKALSDRLPNRQREMHSSLFNSHISLLTDQKRGMPYPCPFESVLFQQHFQGNIGLGKHGLH